MSLSRVRLTSFLIGPTVGKPSQSCQRPIKTLSNRNGVWRCTMKGKELFIKLETGLCTYLSFVFNVLKNFILRRVDFCVNNIILCSKYSRVSGLKEIFGSGLTIKASNREKGLRSKASPQFCRAQKSNKSHPLISKVKKSFRYRTCDQVFFSLVVAVKRTPDHNE